MENTKPKGLLLRKKKKKESEQLTTPLKKDENIPTNQITPKSVEDYTKSEPSSLPIQNNQHDKKTKSAQKSRNSVISIVKEITGALEKEEGINVMPPVGKNKPFMTTISTPKQCDALIKALKKCYFEIEEKEGSNTHVEETESMVVGFDCEYDSHKKVQTVQLSTHYLSAVIQVGNMKSLPDSLLELINSKNFMKGGVGVHEDCDSLVHTFKNQKIQPEGLMDVSLVAIKNNITEGYRSLEYLAKDILRQQKEKSRGGWMKERLSSFQIKYATMDAWMGYSIAKFMYLNLNIDKELSFFEWTKKEETSRTDLITLKPRNALKAKKPGFDDKYAIERREKRKELAQKGVFKNRMEGKRKMMSFLKQSDDEIHRLVASMSSKAVEGKEEEDKPVSEKSKDEEDSKKTNYKRQTTSKDKQTVKKKLKGDDSLVVNFI